MKKTAKYVIFKTEWGFFGIYGTKKGLLRTCLPMAKSSAVEAILLENDRPAELDRQYLKDFQRQISAYFEGAYVDFNACDIPVLLDGYGSFTMAVLGACRKVRYGQTVNYGKLAKMSGRPKAVRAIGKSLSINRLPLIVPCHRVICSNGKIGGFSAPGGVRMKQRMLQLERRNTRNFNQS